MKQTLIYTYCNSVLSIDLYTCFVQTCLGGKSSNEKRKETKEPLALSNGGWSLVCGSLTTKLEDPHTTHQRSEKKVLLFVVYFIYTSAANHVQVETKRFSTSNAQS